LLLLELENNLTSSIEQHNKPAQTGTCHYDSKQSVDIICKRDWVRPDAFRLSE